MSGPRSLMLSGERTPAITDPAVPVVTSIGETVASLELPTYTVFPSGVAAIDHGPRR